MDLMNQIQPPGVAPRAHPERSNSPLPEGMQRALDAAIAQMRHAIAERDRRLEMTCEDSYATRLEHHDAISMLHHILHGMTHPNCNRINLGIVIEDWGYDPGRRRLRPRLRPRIRQQHRMPSQPAPSRRQPIRQHDREPPHRRLHRQHQD